MVIYTIRRGRDGGNRLMCKICDNCNGIMNYDPYFKAEICTSCGKMERILPRKKPKYVTKYKVKNVLLTTLAR